jgi:hypothetical protein
MPRKQNEKAKRWGGKIPGSYLLVPFQGKTSLEILFASKALPTSHISNRNPAEPE